MNTTTTCIVALKKDDTVYLGGDSAAVGGYSIHSRVQPKVFLKDSMGVKMLMGYTTSFRMGQLLQYNLVLPELRAGMDALEYMIVRFVPAIRELFAKEWRVNTEKGTSNGDYGGTFLIGFQGRIFTIHCDFQVGESLDPFSACGCGDDLALGSLFADSKTGFKKPEESVRTALEAAAHFSAGVRAPFHVLSL